MKIKRLIIIVLCLIVAVAGCSASDSISDPVYIKTLYSWNGTGWQAVIGGGGIGVEVDPIFATSPSSTITAGNIVAWNAIVGSQWTTDANGINYSSGNIGVNTPSVATKSVNIYSNSGVSNNPVLEVDDNSASAGAKGINVSMIGAKTDATYGIWIDNAATSGTGGIDKYGLYIKNSSVWDGVGSTNYGIYVAPPAGGTSNVAIYASGNVTVTENLTAKTVFAENIVLDSNALWKGTSASGTATIAAGDTLVGVPHGLGATPTRVQVIMTSDPGLLLTWFYFWSDNKTSSNFTIHGNVSVINDTTFDWRATVGEGN